MTPEESQELFDAVSAISQQDVHLGRVLHRIISYLPGFARVEQPAPEFAAPVESEQARGN